MKDKGPLTTVKLGQYQEDRVQVKVISTRGTVATEFQKRITYGMFHTPGT
jgi:hypothetical protein